MFHALGTAYELFVCELFRWCYIIVSLKIKSNVARNAILFTFKQLLLFIVVKSGNCG